MPRDARPAGRASLVSKSRTLCKRPTETLASCRAQLRVSHLECRCVDGAAEATSLLRRADRNHAAARGTSDRSAQQRNQLGDCGTDSSPGRGNVSVRSGSRQSTVSGVSSPTVLSQTRPDAAGTVCLGSAQKRESSSLTSSMSTGAGSKTPLRSSSRSSATVR